MGCADPEWEAKPEWNSRSGRRAHKEEIHALIGEQTRTNTSQHWIETLNAANVTCGPIYSMDQVFEDEQVKHLGMVVPVQHPSLGPMRLLGSPLNFAGTPRSIRRATPDSGADSNDVLLELGYSAARIAELRSSGVV